MRRAVPLFLRASAHRAVQVYCGVTWEIIMKVGTSPLSLLQRVFGARVWDTGFATGLLDLTYVMVFLSRLPVGFMRIAGLRDGFRQKFLGIAPVTDGSRPVIWIHAVSLGEMLMVRPLVSRLVTERPDLEFVLSSRTKEGFDIARQSFPELRVFYAPFDFSWAVTRAFDILRPRALVIVEQDLWINIMRISERRSVPVAVVNGRMEPDDRKHLRRFNQLPGSAFARIRLWTVTSRESIEGVQSITGPEYANVEIAGFLKADASTLPGAKGEPVLQLKKLYGFGEDELIWVAGSTHFPEESILLDVFLALSAQHPELRLVIAPRHEPFRVVEQVLLKKRIAYIKRSQMHAPLAKSFPVTLVDRFGELPALWKIAHFGFVGGSLRRKWGGHNVLEPAASGVPVCIGPYVSTFNDVTKALIASGGAMQVSNATDIEQLLAGWLEEPESARSAGERALSFVRSQQGATEKTIAALERILPPRAEGIAW